MGSHKTQHRKNRHHVDEKAWCFLALSVTHRTPPVNHDSRCSLAAKYSLVLSGQVEYPSHMARLHRIFKRQNMRARIVMMIHDSLWLEAPQEEAAQVRHLVRRMMETARKPSLKVPLKVDFV
jgi:hypothetical protein